MKTDRHGQACVLSDSDYSKIRKQIKSKKYKLLLDLAWYTGERWGALVQLRIEDCYLNGIPREYINFRARTRKASPDGSHQTRQVFVHAVLRESLQNYKPETNSAWMFSDRTGDKSITLRWADMILRAAVEKAGLTAKGVSTHSTRRSFITKLHRNGCDLYTIKKITGHKDFKALERYVEIDSDRVKTELIEGRLLLLDSEKSQIVNTYIAASGLPNNQTFNSLWSPGRGSIPPQNITGIDHYTVTTTPIYMPDVRGVEGNFYAINPHLVTVNGVERGDFGVHFDANVPGSSGCVVLRTDIGWQAFGKDIKALADAGVKEIPLLVSYSR